VVWKDAKAFAVVNVGQLNVFENDEVVSPTSLVAKGLVAKRHGKLPKVKILAFGEITKKIKVENCLMSAAAEAKINA
jgi:large subunit ribosomal protein L15